MCGDSLFTWRLVVPHSDQNHHKLSGWAQPNPKPWLKSPHHQTFKLVVFSTLITTDIFKQVHTVENGNTGAFGAQSDIVIYVIFLNNCPQLEWVETLRLLAGQSVQVLAYLSIHSALCFHLSIRTALVKALAVLSLLLARQWSPGRRERERQRITE